jgi:hypothetical protein
MMDLRISNFLRAYFSEVSVTVPPVSDGTMSAVLFGTPTLTVP